MQTPELNIFVSKEDYYINFVIKLQQDGRVYFLSDEKQENVVNALMNSQGSYSYLLNLISMSLELIVEDIDMGSVILLDECILKKFIRVISHEYLHYTMYEVNEADKLSIFEIEGVIDNLLGD